MAKTTFEFDFDTESDNIILISNLGNISSFLFDLKYNFFRRLIDHNTDETISADTISAYEHVQELVNDLMNEYNISTIIQ